MSGREFRNEAFERKEPAGKEAPEGLSFANIMQDQLRAGDANAVKVSDNTFAGPAFQKELDATRALLPEGVKKTLEMAQSAPPERAQAALAEGIANFASDVAKMPLDKQIEEARKLQEYTQRMEKLIGKFA